MNLKRKNLFDTEKINTKRQLELDIAKGLAVLFMVAIHVQEYFATEQMQETVLGETFSFLGGMPAAPVFMFLLGVGVEYSRNQDPFTLAKRGMMTFLSGYVLNILRAVIPALLAGWWLEDSSLYSQAVFDFWTIDILQFAGLAMIFIACIKELKFTNRSIVWTIVLIVFSNGFINNIWVGENWVGGLTGLIWGSSYYSFFPFLTWIIYPLVGIIFGSYLIRCKDTKSFYRLILGVTAVALIPSSFIYWNYAGNSEYSYYHHGIIENIQYTLMVLFWLSILYSVSRYLPNLITQYLKHLSRIVNTFYFIHWIVIGWLVLFIGYNTLDSLNILLTILSVTVLSDFLSVGYLNRNRKK